MGKRPRPKDVLDQTGARLRAARMALGMTAKDFCASINVQQNTYSHWEKGHNLLDPIAARRIKKIYGISLDYLYSGDFATLPFELGGKIRDQIAKSESEIAQ